jgi:hypothetical protein
MAGAGYKLFNTGDVLTAAQVNTYLMQQTVMVFASSTARTTALSGVLAEGMISYLSDTNDLQIYDGSAWVSYGSGDITGVTATSPLTGGGTSGTVTVGIQDGSTTQKGAIQLTDSTSSTSTTTAATPNSVKTSYDLANAAIPKSTVTTNGDLIYGTGSAAVTRLGIGSTGQVLTVAGGVPTWAAAAGGGKVLQVVSTTKTDTFTTTSSTFTDVTGYSVSITPSNTTSKILVHYDISVSTDGGTHCGRAQLMRNSTAIKIGDAAGNRTRVTGQIETQNYYNDLPLISGSYLDSPSTTSSVTYKVQVARVGGTGSDIVCVNRGELDDDTAARPRGACTITVLEIGA